MLSVAFVNATVLGLHARQLRPVHPPCATPRHDLLPPGHLCSQANGGRSWADQTEEEEHHEVKAAEAAGAALHSADDDEGPPPGFEGVAPAAAATEHSAGSRPATAEEATAVAQLAGMAVSEEPQVDEPDLSIKVGMRRRQGWGRSLQTAPGFGRWGQPTLPAHPCRPTGWWTRAPGRSRR